jgi:hypothetical protein
MDSSGTTPGRGAVVELDDVPLGREALARMFATNGPYWNQGRYLPGAGAASQMPGGATTTVGVPWYRQDWALGGRSLVPGAGALLDSPAFAGAARAVFGGSVVRPHTIYANVQLPATGTDFGHTDVPEFRGVTRAHAPVALLHLMNRSGLFTRWQLDIATAVTWLWDGPRGAFVLWRDGPDVRPSEVGPPLTGRAVVADNDRLFHAVGAFDTPNGPAPSLLTPQSEVHAAEGGFELRHGTEVVGGWPAAEVRCSVSWKAYVFADDTAARVADEHLDDLDAATVAEVFVSALRERGVDAPGAATLGLDDSLVALAAPVWPKRLPVPPG